MPMELWTFDVSNFPENAFTPRFDAKGRQLPVDFAMNSEYGTLQVQCEVLCDCAVLCACVSVCYALNIYTYTYSKCTHPRREWMRNFSKRSILLFKRTSQVIGRLRKRALRRY